MSLAPWLQITYHCSETGLGEQKTRQLKLLPALTWKTGQLGLVFVAWVNVRIFVSFAVVQREGHMLCAREEPERCWRQDGKA